MWGGKMASVATLNALADSDLPFECVPSLKVLGVVFENNVKNIQVINYAQLLPKTNQIMSAWKGRSLTLIGKITIIKTLILPQFIHLFTALPKPDITLMKQFKKLLFTFLSGSKREKIKRKIIVRRYEDGGLRMVDLEVYIAALKASWIKRQLMSTHPWTTLFKDVIAEDCRIWELIAFYYVRFLKQLTTFSGRKYLAHGHL
jgi:hypothetical protein